MIKLSISSGPLRRVLEALNGPPHLIRELQATRGPLVGDDNPINILVNEFNEQIREQENGKKTKKSNGKNRQGPATS